MSPSTWPTRQPRASALSADVCTGSVRWVADPTRHPELHPGAHLPRALRSLSDKETRAAAFFVPTAEGWISAEAAMLGAGWDVPNGKKLQALLRLGADSSADLRQSLALP